uniref:Aminoacyl-tRNA synthetase, class 1a, anticodon-binding n=1 Tax=Tanacetum cinerariifolium TaxID=118510 RepID=A0A6L2LKT2_TANCI|nr:hypothetical protein [Tanacetum cinerariifolium]
MATLRYKDEHNKVGYLLKPTGSDDYHQIINFLRASQIRYSLTHNPIIFDSLVKQFWSMATLMSPELGPPAIQATIDKTPYTITEELVRSEGAEVATQAIPQNMPAPDQPQDYLSTPPSQQTSDPHASVLKHGQNEPLGGSFHMSSPGFTQAPPAGQPSGGAEDPITLTALSSKVSTLVQKVNSLETELKDHKKLFKDVVGKLVRKVKSLKVKLSTKKRKMVVIDFNQKEGGKQDVDLDALRALANAAVTIDSNIPPGGASHIPAASTSVPTVVPAGATVVPAGALTIPPGASTVPTGASPIPPGSPSVPADVSPSVAPAGVSNKGKSLMVEKEIHVKERTFKQMLEDILGEQAAKRLHDEKQAQMDRQRAELWRLMYLSLRHCWAQQRAYMRQFVKNHSSVVYTTGWSMAYVKSFTDDQLKEEFEKIRKVQSNSQIQAFSRTLKRTGLVLEEPSSKRKKSLGRKRLTKPKSTLQELDLDADAQTFIKVVSTEDSNDEAPVWSTLFGWEVISTPLGDINALYRINQSTKHFTTLRQILHMVDIQDLVKLYGLVFQYYENHPVAGAGLILWGDLQVLFDSHKGETVFGEVLYMFADVSYPLSVKLMDRMLTHKLEIDTDVMGNDMTIAEQLIQFIKNQLAAAQVSFV